MNTLVVPDVHFPFHDPESIKGMLSYIHGTKFGEIVFLGDFFDFPQLSHYLKSPDQYFRLQSAITHGMKIFDSIVSGVDKEKAVKIIFLRGNHEQRLEKYLLRNAVQLADLDALTIPNLLGFQKRGVEYKETYYRNKDDVIFIHGHRVRGKSGYTAHAYFDQIGENVVSGHVHRLALVYKTYYYRTLFGIEAGSLCLETFSYLGGVIPDWQKGFVTITDGRPEIVSLPFG